MDIRYYGLSKRYGIFPESDGDYYKSKEDAFATVDFADDHEISEIDIDTEEFILRNVPPELKSPLSGFAYDKAHSYGHDETKSYLKELVSDLLPAILSYGKRMKNS